MTQSLLRNSLYYYLVLSEATSYKILTYLSSHAACSCSSLSAKAPILQNLTQIHYPHPTAIVESTDTGSSYQCGGSKRKTAVPIRYITYLGFTDDKTYKNDNAAKSGEVNSNGDHHPTNYDDISLDESMGLGHNQVDIIALSMQDFFWGAIQIFFFQRR